MNQWTRFARVPLAAGVVAAALGVAAPVAAASVKPAADLPHIVLAPGDGGRSEFVSLRNGGAAVTLHDITVTVDVTGVSGVASVQPFADDRCSPTVTGFTCELGEQRLTGGYQPLVSLIVRSLEGAAAGQSGTVASTVTTREFGATVRRSTVTIAEPVAFKPGELINLSVKPGRPVALPLTLRNTGARPVTSSVMWFFREGMYGYPQSFSNCRYGKVRVFCRFDDDVPAGATYRLAEPLKMTVRAQVPAPEVIGQSFFWATPADARNELESFLAEKPKAGTGKALRLVPAAGTAPPATGGTALPQTAGSNWFFPEQTVLLKVTGRNVADLAAIGATARAKAGKTVAAAVGARNLGPAFVFGVRVPAAKVVVKRPAGTTVVAVPAGCVPSANGKPVPRKDPRGAAEYLCTTTVVRFEVGQRVTWKFQLRVDRKGALAGSVRVVSSAPDGKRGNDAAKLKVNPS